MRRLFVPQPSLASRLASLPMLAAWLSITAGAWLMHSPLNAPWCLAINQSLGSTWPVFWAALSWSALGVTSLVLLTALSSAQVHRVAAMLVCLVVGGLAVHAVKRLVESDRPLVFFSAQHVSFHVVGDALRHHAMPSGHSATAWAVCALMLLGWGAGRRPVWVWFWLPLAALQALSRVVVGAHWLSDVLVGSGMGLLCGTLCWHLPFTARLATQLGRPRARQGVALVLAALGLFLALDPLGNPIGPLRWAMLPLGLAGAWAWWRSARPEAGQSLPH
jgi:membrane-associated phospholipid phosphatase